MRGKVPIVLVAGVTGLALLACTRSVDAMPLSAPSGLAAAREEIGSLSRVRSVCEKQWDGYQWQDRCRTTGSGRYRYHYGSAQIHRLERRLLYYLRRYSYW